MTADRRALLDALAETDAELVMDIDTTAVKRRAALVERVAKVIALAYDYGGDERWLEMAFHSKVSRKRYPAQAKAAIDIIRSEVLEEAAMVADRYEIPMAETSASHIAAAIRALKSKGNGNDR